MLNPEKTETASRIMVFEQGTGRDALKLRTDYEGKGTAIHRLRNALCAAFGYVCIVALLYCAFGYKIIDLSDNFAFSVLLIAAAVIVGAVFTVIYSRLVFRFGEIRYRNIRSSLVRYDLLKKKNL